jgi:anti-sigma factor ChrR (cupin superfamily)
MVKTSRLVIVAAMSLLPCLCVAQTAEKKPAAKPHAMNPTAVSPDQLKWGPPPEGAMVGKPSVEPGGQAAFAVVAGNPLAVGQAYVMRIKCSDGFKIAPHWHPVTENVTVLRGALSLGMGDHYDESAMNTFSVGSFLSAPARMHHFAACKGDTELQIHGLGPFKFMYIAGTPPAKKMAAK